MATDTFLMCGKKQDERYDHAWCVVYPWGVSFTVCPECSKKYTLAEIYAKLKEGDE